MRWWKVVGLAGIAGVAATGVVIARAERRRRAYTPEEIRDRLRARVAESAVDGVQPSEAATGFAVPGAGRGTWRERLAEAPGRVRGMVSRTVRRGPAARAARVVRAKARHRGRG
ncbi:hypothetical protein [Nocardiopsis ansamitocini]|uniref:Uncharacterized protein n=1 Tax=Nocardiopsis ansamitocini TaxID=1670832 RepID=A0A9W6UH18_9ACTN|nr:hypothetical protein [Nocardiopsis ansamitocini]GLU46277.1 hypothetical protein Nans01_06280 [Nocardiopsis ansamitocini]